MEAAVKSQANGGGDIQMGAMNGGSSKTYRQRKTGTTDESNGEDMMLSTSTREKGRGRVRSYFRL